MSDQDTQDVSLITASPRSKHADLTNTVSPAIASELQLPADQREQDILQDVLTEDLAKLFFDTTEPTQENLESGAALWACARLAAGHSPRDLGNAIIAVAARTRPFYSQSTDYSTSSPNMAALLTAATVTVELADRQENSIRQAAAIDSESARLSAVLVVAIAASAFNSAQPTQPVLANPHEHPSTALADFWQATSEGEPTPAAQSWLRLEELDSTEAQNALVSAASTRYCVDELPLILATRLASSSPSEAVRQQLLAGVVERIAQQEIDEELALDQRMQAQLLAEDAQNRSPETDGRLERASNERLSALATGIARTPREQLNPLLLASLHDGLSPEDLVDTLALLRAAAYSVTSPSTQSGSSDQIWVDPKHAEQSALRACIAADAVQLCMARTECLSLRYELALAAPSSPSARVLAPLAELWVPPFDSSGLADTLLALSEADPDTAAEAATAIDPLDHESTDTAWCAFRRAAASDCSLHMQRLVQVAALERGFRGSSHPAKIWFLSAAARTAAHARSHPDHLSALAENFLS